MQALIIRPSLTRDKSWDLEILTDLPASPEDAQEVVESTISNDDIYFLLGDKESISFALKSAKNL